MKIPRSTYRLQFSRAFTFHDASPVIEYLERLGVGGVYASPVFKARKGSLHGYDVINPNEINPEIGTEGEFSALTALARDKGLAWLQDIVPNHMSYSGENESIMDILENGHCSRYIDFYDIEWDHPFESIRGKLLAPFLGKFYGDALESGEITLSYDETGLSVNYYELALPLRIESYIRVFTNNLSSLKRDMGQDNSDFIRFLGTLYSMKHLSEEEGNTLYEHTESMKRMLWNIYRSNDAIRRFVDDNIALFNGKPGVPESFNPLEKLLAEQLFRLSFWKVAAEEINYRRFFNINELISLRMEDEKVFRHTHRFIFRLLREGKVSALRVDHIDGLYDPTLYLKRLREASGDVYIAVEKILGLTEDLPPMWPVQGTTGYDFVNFVNGLFVQRESASRLDRIYRRFIGFEMNYPALVFDKKRLIIGKYMAGDIDGLARLLKNVSSRERHGSDITMYGLKRALVDVLALFPVYRTYINHEYYTDVDRKVINGVFTRAKEINPGLLNELSFIEKFLLLEFNESLDQGQKDQWTRFVMRFQQFTGPLMAKGFEDTTLYVYNRFISLNEVGGDPGTFGIAPETFHLFNAHRAERRPHALNATATHDTKRGEDVRARLDVISELPDEWRQLLRVWSRLNRDKKGVIDGKEYPDRNDEYFFYQALAGSFPFYEHEYASFVRRVKEYMIKAVREAKIFTAWLKPDDVYENAFLSFIEKTLLPLENNPFLKEFMPFQRKIAHYGIFNSLSQLLLKITSPGVPDFFQGTELWDLSMVDPDNRRPVDFAVRRALLSDIIAKGERDLPALIDELLATWEDGRIKLFLTHAALKARNALPDIFGQGEYLPIIPSGRYKRHIVSFARRLDNDWAVVVVPCFLTGIVREGDLPFGNAVWANTSLTLPDGAPLAWKDALTGKTVAPAHPILHVGDILARFPVSLLIGRTTPPSRYTSR